MSERLSSAEARARIIAATAALIEERGAVMMSVTEVMRRAQVSRTAFYRQFTDLYAVLAALLETIGGELLANSGAWLNDPASVGSRAVIYPNLLGYARAYAPHGRLLGRDFLGAPGRPWGPSATSSTTHSLGAWEPRD